MKLSEHTVNVLKNFSTVYSRIILRPGKVQKTIAPGESILAIAELDEITDYDFGIYDLNQFLGNVTTLKDPDLEFSKNSVTMTSGKLKLTYHACPTELIDSPPDRDLPVNNPDVSFSLPSDVYNNLLKLAAMNSLPHLSVISKDSRLFLRVHDFKNDTSNVVDMDIGTHDSDFVATFNVENLKLLSDDYDVDLLVGKFARFQSKNKGVKYYIGLESKNE